MAELMLPGANGRERHVLAAGSSWPTASAPPRSRVVFAAAHVAAQPGPPAEIDWDATLAFRHHLWTLGFGVAEAMDTAQRGMGLDWEHARELIARCGREARVAHGRLACGAGTDQLAPGPVSLARIRAAYEEQIAVVEDAGAQVILMASRALAATARDAEDYLSVYDELLRQACRPVIVHWLGAQFDAGLAGYWGSDQPRQASETLLSLIAQHPGKVDGVKVSLLDAELEVQIRRGLPGRVRMYTGDDFHYPELIRGDEGGFSDALLGVFDPIAPAAATALQALDRGEGDLYMEIMRRTLPLARTLFEAPTHAYKTGIALLAWLCGHQQHFTMLAGNERARPLDHLVRLFRAADELELFPDPELAAARIACLLDGPTPRS